MDLLKEIGAILGFVAFGGLAVLAFLTFQQARHLRRLREWAGRQPERAAAEADAVSARAEEEKRPPGRDEPSGPSRVERLRGEASVRMEELDRRSPVDVRILVGALLAVLIGVAIATSGFGLIGGDSTTEPTTADSAPAEEEEEVEVAVLNGTAPEVGGVGVEGVADRASEIVKAAGFKVGPVGDAGSFPTTLVMFEEGSKSEARELAEAIEGDLGPTEVEIYTPEIQEAAGKASVALVIGLDDAGI